MAKTRTTVPTKTSGDTITVTNWNTHLAQNVNAVIQPPAARIARYTTQSIPNSTWTAIQFTAEELDTDSMVDLGSNNEIITISQTGQYLVCFRVDFATNTTGYRSAYVQEGVINQNIRVEGVAPVTGARTTLNAAMTEHFSAAGTVSLEVIQNSGGALNVETAYLSVVQVST